jgi:hypothetical protein
MQKTGLNISNYSIFTLKVFESKTLLFLQRIKSPDRLVEAFVLALPIFPGSRPPSIIGVHVLNFCVRDGREPERCLRQIQRGRSVCSGLHKTSPLRRATFLQGTANGNRWTPTV